MDEGPDPITDAEELRRVRSQARRVHVQAFLLAALVTAMVVSI